MEHFNLKLHVFALVLLLTPHRPGHTSIALEDFLPESTILRLQQIIDLTINQKYDDALKICHTIQREQPDHPAGYFFEAATMQAIILDYESDEIKDEFLALTAKVNKLCKQELRKRPKNSWLFFFMGGALGYEAYFLGREQKYLRAFNEGWNSIQSLETAIALDSTNYDAYLGIGTYKYYRSKLSKYLNWLPFIGDEKEAGIKMIEVAIEKGKFSKGAALNALIWIYIGEKKFRLARELLERALEQYPNSRFFLWAGIKIATEQNNLYEAEIGYKQILKSYAGEGKRSFYNELVCHAQLAEIYAVQNKNDLAYEHATKALAIEIKKSRRKKAGEYRKMAEKILKRSW